MTHPHISPVTCMSELCFLTGWCNDFSFLIYNSQLKTIPVHSVDNQVLTTNTLYSKDLARNMGQGDENLDQDVILKFIQVTNTYL